MLNDENICLQACIENGYFYLINHEVEGDLIRRVFDGSRGFFDLSIGEKMKVLRKNHRGYTPFYDEKLDLVDNPKGSFHFHTYVRQIDLFVI